MINQITMGIVTVFGVISAFTIFSAPISLQNTESGIQLQAQSEARGPASVVTVSSEMGKQMTIDVLTVNCGENVEVYSQSQQVRLKGKVCMENTALQIKGSSIRNNENKDVATVFLMKRDFTTDVIDLPKENNELTIVNQLSNGQSETRTVKIKRKKIVVQK